MWTITSTLLLTCCLQAALAQTNGRDDDEPGPGRNIWEDVIEFLTRGTKDECYMSVTGQGDLTKLRISCHGLERSYWCEYHGKPQVCRNYNKNPQHYFKQIMWDLRKLPHACQGKSVLKPIMCKRASEEAQMVFKAASSADAVPRDRPYRPAHVRTEQMRPQQRPRPTRPQLKTQSGGAPQDKPNHLNSLKSTSQREMFTPTEPQPTTQVPMSEAKKLAQGYCWRSFHGVCSWVIGWFRD
ncbi:fibroblast growth factor binding protein 2a [Pseudorasbora parva]|uniref:fibroblast growth factor binding protein 2a n=1 Tax=Pseudorasbora parva TaxID=51549 RepID=UPI00351DDAE5